jgi:hypothetical protein
MTNERMGELFNSDNKGLRVCIGNWKAYNEGGKHGLGTCYKGRYYIDLTMLESEEELTELLVALGWSEAEREELFIQDYESEHLTLEGCDYINPFSILKAILESGIDLNEEGAKVAAIMEYTGKTLEEAIVEADDYGFYKGLTGEEYEEQFVEECYPDLSFDNIGYLSNFITFDYKAMARDDDYIYETDAGVLVRR